MRDADNFKASCYHPHLEIAQSYKPCEVMIMTSQALNLLNPEKRRDAYFEIAEHIKVPASSMPLNPLLFPGQHHLSLGSSPIGRS